MNFSKQALVEHFGKRSYQPSSPSYENKSAAVLVPLTFIDGQWHLLFIRRAENEEDIHSGQVAFPGGISERTDVNVEATALREAREEIGLVATDVQIIGSLSVFNSISDIPVFPIVGLVPWPYQFSLQREEVSRVFTVPLKWLAEERNYQIKQRTIPIKTVPVDVIYYDEYDGEQLWGLTARIAHDLLDAIKL